MRVAWDNVDDACLIERISDMVRWWSDSGVTIRTVAWICGLTIDVDGVLGELVKPVIRLLTAVNALQPTPRTLTAASAAELTTAWACCLVVGFSGGVFDGLVASGFSIGVGSGNRIDARDDDEFVLWLHEIIDVRTREYFCRQHWDVINIVLVLVNN